MGDSGTEGRRHGDPWNRTEEDKKELLNDGRMERWRMGRRKEEDEGIGKWRTEVCCAKSANQYLPIIHRHNRSLLTDQLLLQLTN